MATPGSLSRRQSRDAIDKTIPEGLETNGIFADLSLRWGLTIKPPRDGESPSKRQEKRAVASKAEQYADECFFKINFLSRKEKKTLSSAYDRFQKCAPALQVGWVHKPNADEDLLPRSNGIPGHPKSLAQREQLFECLLRCIDPVYEETKQQHAKEARTLREKMSFNDVPGPVITPQSRSHNRDLDDTPIPFSLDPRGKGKRRSDDDTGLNDNFKRTRMPQDDSDSQMIIDAIDGVPVMTRRPEYHKQPTMPEPVPVRKSRPSRTISAIQAITLDEDVASENGGSVPRRPESTTANTSFTSINSTIFDDDSDASDATYYSTQTSTQALVLDSTFDRRWVPEPPQTPPIEDEETHYGSSFDEQDLDPEFSSPHEDLLRQRLQNVFPDLPPSLEDAPLPVRYEITRICIHANVDVMDLHFPNLDFSKFSNYDNLWTYLRNYHALKGKDFPEKSDLKAWKASFGTFLDGFHGVVLSAKLKLNNNPEGPLFKLQLQSLKLERSHRLGRRFGPDRFIELSLPSLTGKKLPKLFKDAEQAGRGDSCRQVFVKWLSRQQHDFLGINWGTFCLKDSVSKKKKTKFEITVVEDIDNSTKFCVYLFATDGLGFQTSGAIPSKGEPLHRHTKMSVPDMLNWLIPLDQNKKQRALKLFSRIALGLSKTWNTVEVQPKEFRYPPDLMSNDNKEVMNDGCGRLSLKIAKDIAQCLGLNPTPSAFQGRIGGAKGLWLVDFNDCSDQKWIEIYPSQTKWSRDGRIEHSGNDDPDHRTFEVVDWARPLRSAVLTLQFLQILEDRGKSRRAMRDAISSILVTGLRHEIDTQRGAMDSPQGFRQWVRSNNSSGLQDRIKHGQVPHRAGLPHTLEEQLNMLLDAGFNPRKLHFLKDLAWKLYKGRCEVLKQKLNIVVGLSANAYIAVDYQGVLEPDEVYLNFSNTFTVEASGFSECLLDGIDILVARSPAHYISDIQKVKTVWKRELKSVKDVIVFSSKGNYPLAKKLSGGDYDGDMAWICWEPSMVNEFVNAEPPPCPNLIELGHIRQEKTVYADLASEHTDPVPEFLELAINFNLHANMLGLCTSFKDDLCYTMKSVNNDKSVFLSTLLSDLVDQHKQGYIFTSASWDNIKSTEIKIKTHVPAYKQDTPPAHINPSNAHIIDHLKFVVAEQTIQSTLTKFHNSLQDAEYWDHDVVQAASWARQLARTSAHSALWAEVVQHIEEKIAVIKTEWKRKFRGKRHPEALGDFAALVTHLHDKWVAIAPPEGNPLSEALTPSCLPSHGAEYSTFALLKASIGFSMCNRQYVPKFIWWMAGRQLAALKATYLSVVDGEPDITIGPMAVVAPHMYAMLKPDNTFVKLLRKQEADPGYSEAVANESMIGDDGGEGDDWED